MGLRLVEGVSKERLFDRYGVDLLELYGDVLAGLQTEGLLDWNDTHMFLTDKGLRYANRVMAELI